VDTRGVKVGIVGKWRLVVLGKVGTGGERKRGTPWFVIVVGDLWARWRVDDDGGW
jgi:hypothetical protein